MVSAILLKSARCEAAFKAAGAGLQKIKRRAAAPFRTLGETHIIYQTIIDTRE